jgi:hypothetical protein
VSTQDEDEELHAELDAAEAAADESESDDEREKRRKKGNLSEEVAARWSPERLLQMVAGRAGRGERLDEQTRQKFERRLGVDLSGVRLYTGEFAEEVTKAHTAEAVTIGNTGMILMSGTPERSMGTTAGQALLAHELTHVAQAQRGLHFALEDGGGQDAPHEKAAEKVESEAYAAETGGGGKGGGKGGGGGADLERMIIERVFEIAQEEMRLHRDRLGPDEYDE